MGGIINIRKKLGAGSIPADGNDVFEVERNQVVQKDYIVPDIQYEPDSSKLHFEEVKHMARIDVDNLTDAQLRSIHNSPDYEIYKPFGTP